MLDAVELQLQSGGAIDTLLNMLTELETQLNNDQKTADEELANSTAAYEQRRDQLNDEIAQTSEDLNDAIVKKNHHQEEVNSLTATL